MLGLAQVGVVNSVHVVVVCAPIAPPSLYHSRPQASSRPGTSAPCNRPRIVVVSILRASCEPSPPLALFVPLYCCPTLAQLPFRLTRVASSKRSTLLSLSSPSPPSPPPSLPAAERLLLLLGRRQHRRWCRWRLFVRSFRVLPLRLVVEISEGTAYQVVFSVGSSHSSAQTVRL